MGFIHSFKSHFVESLFLIVFFSSCLSDKKTAEKENILQQQMILEFAKGFSVEHSASDIKITVKDPWQYASNIEFEYFLNNTVNSKKKIKIPIEKAICLSTTHLAYISKLGEEESIIGITNSKLVTDSLIKKQIALNKTFDIGNEQALNYELILNLRPDVIFAYGVGAEVQQLYQKFHEWGIPVIMVSEYLENSPLAKAEWLKFFAQFYQKEVYADSLFKTIADKYLKLNLLVKKVKKKPKVMSSLPWKDVWYVPGGDSFMAKFIEDAGGDYLWSADTNRESLPLSMEHVFYKAHEAEIWINTGMVNSLTDIESADPRMAHLQPFKTGNVFNNNLRVNQYMGNDFWESGGVNPHLILSDLIQIFHPECYSGHPFFYYQKLQ